VVTDEGGYGRFGALSRVELERFFYLDDEDRRLIAARRRDYQLNRYGHPVTSMLIGYARCFTDTEDLTAQRTALAALGVTPDRIYVDHGLTGTTRARPGLREALAACRSGDTLMVTKLDRLARPTPATSSPSSPALASSSTSAARCTTPTTRSDGCCYYTRSAADLSLTRGAGEPACEGLELGH
jgi:hypothetical protein